MNSASELSEAKREDDDEGPPCEQERNCWSRTGAEAKGNLSYMVHDCSQYEEASCWFQRASNFTGILMGCIDSKPAKEATIAAINKRIYEVRSCCAPPTSFLFHQYASLIYMPLTVRLLVTSCYMSCTRRRIPVLNRCRICLSLLRCNARTSADPIVGCFVHFFV